MMHYVLSCCSTADLSKEHFQNRDIHYICFHYEMDGVQYADDLGESMPFDQFYKAMADGADTKTSQVNVDEFVAYFTGFLEQGLDILHVHVATGVHFVTHDIAAKMFHQMEPNVRYTSRVGAIEIGNNVFIGAGATILYDVKIEDNVMIAAGTLVHKSLAGGAIYAGVPARKIGNFDDYKKRNEEYSKNVPWTDAESFRVRREKQIEYTFCQGEKV